MSADLIVLAGRILLGGVFVGAGLALALGVFVSWAALDLVLFTIVASVLLVNFRDKEGEERIALTNAFQTNIGLIGGLMIAAPQGA
jgi:uncharacterized membrane protein YphA (DoxX/SURF4 family)